MDYVEKEYSLSHPQACKIIGYSRTCKYYQRVMPAKDAKLKEIISRVTGCTRKGREKVIRAVRAKHPEISSSKIRRVYEKEGFILHRKLKRRINNNPANPINIPLTAIRNGRWILCGRRAE